MEKYTQPVSSTCYLLILSDVTVLDEAIYHMSADTFWNCDINVL